MVLKIHRPSGQAATRFVPGDGDGQWSTDLDNDARLRAALRPGQEDFDRPIG